jgi:hypothetical protein
MGTWKFFGSRHAKMQSVVRSWFVISSILKTASESPINRMERTATPCLDCDADGLQTAVVAVANALPAAVAHPCLGVSSRPV